MNSATDIWTRVLDLLKTELTATALNTWFDDCRAVDISDGKFVICSPQKLKRDVIESRFTGNIKAALHELFSSDFNLLVLSEESEREYLMKIPEGDIRFGNNEFTFENFVVGNSNRYAYAAAKAVADTPAEAYNPLFIYGESVLGKTHLMYSLLYVIKKKHPNYCIV